MICMLPPSTFMGGEPAPMVCPEDEISSPGSSPPSEDDDETSDMTKEVPAPHHGDVVDVQLPPTPPVARGDCDSFPDQEKSLESPLKGYRRVLVKHGTRWTLQFVSPEGIRFDSQDELTSHVCRERSDIDPDDLKKLDLHFLRDVDNKENQIAGRGHLRKSDEVLSTQTVPLTFCSMRQNIFDLKRKRGWKRTHNRVFRRNSIAAISLHPGGDAKKISPEEGKDESTGCPIKVESTAEAETKLHSEPEKKKTNLPESPVQHACAKKEPEPVNPAAVHRSGSCDDKLLSNCFVAKEEIVRNSQDNSLKGDVLPITLKEDEEVQIVSCTKPDEEEPLGMRLSDCQVSLVDIFLKTPLNSFQCLGCSRNYCCLTDNFTVNLQCQTLSVVCGHCQWWTSRRISSVFIETEVPEIPENLKTNSDI